MKQTNLTAAMFGHLAALRAKMAICGAYEKREEPTLKSVAEAIDKIAGTFEQYKQANDARLEAIKAGKSTSDYDAKLAAMDERIAQLDEMKSQLEKMETKLARPGAQAGGKEEGESREAAEYRGAFVSWLRAPTDAGRQQRCAQARAALEARQAAEAASGLEIRATQTTTTTGAAGGYAVPEVIERSILRLSVDISPIRQIATVRTVGSTDYKELVDIGGAGFEWVGETDARAQTNTPDLVEVQPTFGMASAKPQASEESLDDMFFNVEDWLISSASEAIAQGEGAAFVLGNGVKKPTGILAGPAPVATGDATRAFGTLQFFASGAAAAMPASADIFLDIVYSLRARYRSNANWLTNKVVLAALRKYKDSTGQYLWQPAMTAGQPSSFLGYSIVEAEDMPTVAANAFPLAFGDFREGYLITDKVGMRMTRDEITTPGFVKFYVRKRTGGKLRNTQAIKLLKIAA
ncbi:phage major capsid protein [Azoarcus indigens]|uniref:HK97 family phage major capsid protein n=1 Tax=Azoarcus indigens TaxID=29545 RepID=A0A4R6DZS6_9RHOO|nr:phage major capsid protein [Azoarcus indigens]NMG64896.1 phage major capsid protein [Azoarcus indigens]TDN50434.1 HK97 family phage major capsid protein [Azoarcus indigens]